MEANVLMMELAPPLTTTTAAPAEEEAISWEIFCPSIKTRAIDVHDDDLNIAWLWSL